MKYFISGFLAALIIGMGASAIAITLDPSQSSIEVAQDCTWGDVKDCYSGHNANRNNQCCKPKVQMENPIGALEVEDSIAKNCTWTEVKLCYDGIANRCCPPKNMEMAQSVPNDESIARDCTWSQVKDCYSGSPNPNNSCCPPKFQMENPIGALDTDDSVAKNCTFSDVKLCYSGLSVANSKCCPPKVQMDYPIS